MFGDRGAERIHLVSLVGFGIGAGKNGTDGVDIFAGVSVISLAKGDFVRCTIGTLTVSK